ncbi:hypothetical protein B0H16DRAFT_1730881 [Mycena metata]|uniref:Uncharacterized protein n=1 Tax=Mycena metata TaxID=1033252 RepID=A0AAD7I8K3_9AGAR|nr:hypothetical protein B0H16DRAFT_1730881 [Mycena metata]
MTPNATRQEHTDKITAHEAPKSEPKRAETPEPEPIPEKGYSLSVELVEFEDLNCEDDEMEEEAQARLIVENSAQWERCLEYCKEYGSNGSNDDEPEPPQDVRGNTMYEDDPSDDQEFYDNRNSIWE